MSAKLPSFVRVVIQNEKGELLVIFQKKWNCWVFPGGKIEANETPLQAAKREVFEETNLIEINSADKEVINRIKTIIKARMWLSYPVNTLISIPKRIKFLA